MVYVYRLAFGDFNFGYASAIGVVWLVLLLIVRRPLPARDPHRHEARRCNGRGDRVRAALEPRAGLLDGRRPRSRSALEATRPESEPAARDLRRLANYAGLEGGSLPFLSFFVNSDAEPARLTAALAMLIATAGGLCPVARAIPAARADQPAASWCSGCCRWW